MPELRPSLANEYWAVSTTEWSSKVDCGAVHSCGPIAVTELAITATATLQSQIEILLTTGQCHDSRDGPSDSSPTHQA